MRLKQRKLYVIKRRNSSYNQSKALRSNLSTNTKSVQRKIRRVSNLVLSIDLSKKRKSKAIIFSFSKVPNKVYVNNKKKVVFETVHCQIELKMSVVSRQHYEDELGTPQDEVIASFIWCDGHICVAYYNVSSLDLFITYEMVDLRPDFCHLHNLFRIMPNMRNVLASGPEVFLTAVMKVLESVYTFFFTHCKYRLVFSSHFHKLLGLPDKMDINQYRVNRLKTLSAATFLVYANNEKTLIENRKRILEMHLPRMHTGMTERERFNFIETVVPLHQTLAVQCLGNLLHFLDANWKHLFLREEARPVISDIKTYKLDGTVLIDESTFNALQVQLRMIVYIFIHIKNQIIHEKNQFIYHGIYFASNRCLRSKTIHRHSKKAPAMHRQVITLRHCSV